MTINNSNISMLDSIIKIDNILYLPISDMAILYNIKIDYIEETKRVVIDELNTGMIKAIVAEDTDIKFKPRALSKNIGTLKEGETVSCFYTTSKGWRQIRTTDGTIGYIKANKLGNEYIVRQDMKERSQAVKIERSNYDNKSFDILFDEEIKTVNLKSTFNITKDNLDIPDGINSNNSSNKVWTAITNKSLEDETNKILQDYKLRTTLIDLILKEAIEKNINGISIDFTGIEDKENMIRFAIESAPKLREVGISTCIVLNENMDEQDYINVVDYIVE